MTSQVIAAAAIIALVAVWATGLYFDAVRRERKEQS